MEAYLTYRNGSGNIMAMRCDRCYNGIAIASRPNNKVICADCRAKEDK